MSTRFTAAWKIKETEDKLPFTLVIKCWEKRESISLRLVYQRIRVSAIKLADKSLRWQKISEY